VAKTKQRQRELARAKWERQQARRSRRATRQRRVSLALGSVGALVVAGLLAFVVVHIVHQEQARTPPFPTPRQLPTPQTVVTSFKPGTPSPTTGGAGARPTSSPMGSSAPSSAPRSSGGGSR
jgi:hypothetical protein